ncbi:hypothetical protein VFPFJ_05167 [Purpureocillium lilacinum]|uniref:Uncharacterized protein n=1 Tax=Purpureocillium lilacinum TaxID=33203 RepID=A0A179HMV7_PURLI|nr:hypothetical protein VFPFJ_05167 [Purpureocillium lilacinum]OAQ91008.1 hypothetical protein VFPFJ_05167 [Purpureocillium lilacinum]
MRFSTIVVAAGLAAAGVHAVPKHGNFHIKQPDTPPPPPSAGTVSYTHLDVYKRQVYMRPTVPAEQPHPTQPFRPDTPPPPAVAQPLPTEPFHPDTPAPAVPPPPPAAPTEEPCEDDVEQDDEDENDNGGLSVHIDDGDPLIDVNMGDSLKVSA